MEQLLIRLGATEADPISWLVWSTEQPAACHEEATDVGCELHGVKGSKGRGEAKTGAASSPQLCGARRAADGPPQAKFWRGGPRAGRFPAGRGADQWGRGV